MLMLLSFHICLNSRRAFPQRESQPGRPANITLDAEISFVPPPYSLDARSRNSLPPSNTAKQILGQVTFAGSPRCYANRPFTLDAAAAAARRRAADVTILIISVTIALIRWHTCAPGHKPHHYLKVTRLPSADDSAKRTDEMMPTFASGGAQSAMPPPDKPREAQVLLPLLDGLRDYFTDVDFRSLLF